METKSLSYLFKISSILNKPDKQKLFLLSLLTIIRSFFELLSLGLIIPILAALTNFDKTIIFINEKFPIFENYEKINLIIIFISLFLISYFLKTLFMFFYNYSRILFCNNLYKNLNQKILKNYLNRNYIFFVENNSSKLLLSISSETNHFTYGIVSNIMDVISHAILIVSFCSFLILFNFNSIYVMILLFLLGFLIIKSTQKNFKKWGQIRLFHQEKVVKSLTEIFASVKEIMIFRKQNIFLRNFNHHLSSFTETTIKRDIFSTLSAPLIEFLSVLLFFIFFIFLMIVVKTDFDEIIILFGVFAFAALKLLPTLINIVRCFQTLRFHSSVVDRVYEELQNKIPYEDFGDVAISTKIKKIKINNLTHFYTDGTKIFENINFEINHDDKIALTGKTGSGKSTLINLMNGLLLPNKGEILINDIKLDNKNFSGQFGYVAQSVYLLDDTLLFNITFENDKSKCNIDRVNQLIKILDLKELVESLNFGIKEIVGERGSKLSGGQIQRIGIARALYKQPSILFLDEATSALDESTEQSILNKIFKEMQNQIVIFSTHRKKVLDYCNKIIEIKNNNISIKKNTND